MRQISGLSGDALVRAIGDVKELYVSGCAAEITALPDLLGEALPRSTVTAILSPLINTRSYAALAVGRRCRTFFMNSEIKRHLPLGVVDLCPWSYSQVAHWFINQVEMDAAIIMVSPPDASNMVSIGVQTDFLPLFRHRVKRLIGVVNPQMPRTRGASLIPLEDFDALFEIDQPLLSPSNSDDKPDPDIDTIAAHVASLVPNGATIQLGLGKVSQAVARGLASHRNLAVVSGLVDDNVLFIEEKGVLDRSRPIVTGAAIGSRNLYDQLHENARFRFAATNETHGLESLLGLDKFYAINTALQVDLFGQVNSEMVNGRVIATPGGFPDFLRGATMNPTGNAIVAVRARGGAKTAPGIVSQMSSPAAVSGAKTDIDVVVTEFGIAKLRSLSQDARADALISVAAPEDRDRLQNDWDAFRGAGKRSEQKERVAG